MKTKILKTVEVVAMTVAGFFAAFVLLAVCQASFDATVTTAIVAATATALKGITSDD